MLILLLFIIAGILLTWASMSKYHMIERTCDATLFFFLAVPFLIPMALAPFCDGWNEGSVSGTCTIPALTELYNDVNAWLMMIAFAGIFFIGPIVLVALATTLILKVIRITRWLRGKHNNGA